MVSLCISVPALAFALFGWTQTSAVPFGDVARYVCVLGSLGAMIMGSMLLNESITLQKNPSQPVNEDALEFLVMMEYEGTKEVEVLTTD